MTIFLLDVYKRQQQIEDSLSMNKKELSVSNLKIISEKATNQRNTSIIFGMLIVLVLIFGLVIIIARSNKQRKLANLALTEKNEEIKTQQLIVCLLYTSIVF